MTNQNIYPLTIMEKLSSLMFTCLFVALLLCTDAGKLCAQETVTLDAIHTMVLENSFAANTAGNQKEIAEQDYEFYKSQLKPGVSLQADLPNYVKTSVPVTQPDGSITFQSISQANSSIGLSASQVLTATGGTVFATTQLSRFDNFSGNQKQYNGIPVRVGIMQPIFGFNPWKYRKVIQPLLKEEAQRSYTIQMEEALTRATSLYFDVLTADQNLKIAQTNQDVNENLLNITEERLTLGKVSKDEKLQLEIELNGARLSLSQAQFQKDQAIAALFTYLGMDIPVDLLFETPTDPQQLEIDIPSLLTAFTANRPEVIAYQRSLAQADADIAEQNALFGPGATITASFGLARGSDNIGDIYQDPFTEQQANIGVSIPILDWGQRKSAVARAKINRQDVQAGFDQQLLELENGITQSAYRISRLQNEISLLKQIMEKADERATISNERYILGDIDFKKPH